MYKCLYLISINVSISTKDARAALGAAGAPARETPCAPQLAADGVEARKESDGEGQPPRRMARPIATSTCPTRASPSVAAAVLLLSWRWRKTATRSTANSARPPRSTSERREHSAASLGEKRHFKSTTRSSFG